MCSSVHVERRHLDRNLARTVAWLNVNRPSDLNFLHVHEAGRWSGVYFVAAGEAPAPTAPPSAGHLLFRGGPRRGGDIEEAETPASHTYFAVPPTPGTLWIFPGTVPHCVLPVRPGEGQEERRAAQTGAAMPDGADASARPPAAGARMSIAVNFDDRAPDPI